MTTLSWFRLNLLAVVARVLTPIAYPLLQTYLRWFRPADYRWYNLADLAWKAFYSGDYPVAAAYSREFLRLAQERRKEWNTGNAIHHGNQILGLVALHEGDINEAKTRLIQAGNTPGSPQLNSFGPKMILARELLKLGERDVVVKYLDLVGKFWIEKNLPPRLDHPVFIAEEAQKAALLRLWKSQARKGIVPDDPQWSHPGKPA